MGTFQWIISAVAFLVFTGYSFCSIKVFIIYFKLRRENRIGDKAFGTMRIRDFKQLEQKTTDIIFKRTIHKLIVYHRARRIIFFGGMLLMVILMVLGGLLKWM